MHNILCDSHITNVTVYARGATITRRVQLPGDLPDAPLSLQVPKISALALPGSFRASLQGGRSVVSLRSQLSLPAQLPPKGPLLERLQALSVEQDRLSNELAQVSSLQQTLTALSLHPKLGEERFRGGALLQKLKGAIGASQLATSLSASLDEKRFSLRDLIAQNAKALDALHLEISQASAEETHGEQLKTRDVFLQLSATGEAREVTLLYTIHAARWWPAYTARISAADNRTKLSIDAFVAQATGEDWKNVALSLSTADLILDARLPELPSLRLSKAQPAPRRNFRPPPKGLDGLYQGYDNAFSDLPPRTHPTPLTPLPSLTPVLDKPKPGGFFSRVASLMRSDVDDLVSLAENPEKMLNQIILEMNQQLVEAKKQTAVAIADEKRLQAQAASVGTSHPHFAEYQRQHQLQRGATEQLKNALRGLQNKIDEARRKKDLLIARSKRSEAQKTIQSTLTGLSDGSAFDTFDRMAAKVANKEAQAEARGDLQLEQAGGFAISPSSDELDVEELSKKRKGVRDVDGDFDALPRLKDKMGLRGGGGGAFASALSVQQTENTEAWLDFSLLEMSDSLQSQQRGRLRIVTQASVNVQLSMQQIESAAPPVAVYDPRYVRGQFDSAYHAEGTCEVLSDARPHRVSLRSVEAPAQQEFLTIPKEDPAVYRFLSLVNPFATPLLAGPVDVFIGGAFLTTSEIFAVDKGASLMLGLGVEERLVVARNVRIEEANTGLLRGRTEVSHFVSIEVSSSLSTEASVKVVDRLPVTDNKDLEVITLASNPEFALYDQSERGDPIRGGVKWQLSVKPSQKSKISLHYKLSLPAKNEVIGGNRRD